MDELFDWLTIIIGGLAILIYMYFVIQDLYQRLRSFATDWIGKHPDEVTEIRIKLDDLVCAIKRGADSFKVVLAGKEHSGSSRVIVTNEVLTRRKMEALYKRELKNRMVLAVAC